MKRLTLLLTIIMMTTASMMAEHVTPETARKVAAAFLNNNGTKASQLTDLSKAAGFANLYIFTTESSFVVMAADDCVKPILGYSLTNKFEVDGMPNNIFEWLKQYNNEILYAVGNYAKATDATAQAWKDLKMGKQGTAKATPMVGPLVQTQWNQNGYSSVYLFNNLCPSVSSGGHGGHAFTGCVATAMAQIMKYWEYPSKGIGFHSYLWNGLTLSADYGSTSYEWQLMTNTYSGTSTAEEKYAVDLLMYHCGVSVEMNYGGNGSSASTYAVMSALQKYFNYHSSMHYEVKEDYSDSAWIAMVKAELDARRPMQYRGSGEGGEGHSFVCDGYNSDDYFHFNWGWAGSCDGYYSLEDLTTSDPGTGGGNGSYTINQAAIFGIQPVQCSASAPTNLTYTLNGIQDITLSWTSASGATSYNIYCNNYYVGNSTTNSYTGTVPFGTNAYYVRSVDSNGELSLASNYVTVTVEYQTPIVDDLSATLSGNTVNLFWTAPDWCYPETPSQTLSYGDNSLSYIWSYTYYAHRYLADDLAQYANKAVYKVSTYVWSPGTYSAYVYTNTTSDNKPDPNALAMSKEGIIVSSTGWCDFDCDSPIILSGETDLWVVMKQENTGQSNPVPSFNLSEHNTNAFYASTTSPTNLYDGYPDLDCAWYIKAYLTDGTYTYNLYHDGIEIAENLSNTSYNTALNANATNQFTVKTNYYGGKTDDSNMVGFTKGNASLASLELGVNDQMTVTKGSKLTVSGTLINNNPDHLILEDGAQLINGSEGVKATVKKAIQPYTEGLDNGWNLIASPITEQLDADDDVNGLVSGTYDLYIFDQNGSDEKEWCNYKAQTFTIDNKVGYLYSNNNETTISFAGTLAGTVTPTTITRTSNVEFEGFNLIGNPYPCEVYTNQPYYTLQYNEEEDKTSFVLGESGSPISPCTAILVQAQAAEESVTFSKTPLAKQASIAMRLTKPNTRSSRHIDQARISFEAGCQLSKYTWDDASSTIYIPQNGQNFAVAYANGANEMPININVVQNGTYTISFELDNLNLNYLHLIDNMTGTDVDLLATPKYTFEGKTTDYASRFRIVFICEDENNDNETFAYYANDEIRVAKTCYGASLQIVDLTGRTVCIGDAINRVSTNGMTPGVYVLRLINGNDVKTQKIVIE